MNRGNWKRPSYRAQKATSQEDMRGHVCSSAPLVWHLLHKTYCLSSLHTPPAPAAGPLRTLPSRHPSPPPPPPPRHSLCLEDGGGPFPISHPHGRRYLVLEFPILKEPQLILAFQIVSVNVAEVYLTAERESPLRSLGLPHR